MNSAERYLKKNSKELYDAIMNKNLWFVRSTEIYNEGLSDNLKNGYECYFDMDRINDRNDIFSIPSKPLFNQSVNLMVLPFTSQNVWDCKKYVFVSPMKEYIGELIGGVHQDYLTMGKHKFSRESYLLVPKNEFDKVTRDFKTNGNLQSTIIGYNYNPKLLGELGVDCLDQLKSEELIRPSIPAPSESPLINIENSKTPREAVNNLFLYLRNVKGINVYMPSPDYEYKNKTLVPKIRPSSDENDEYSLRLNNVNKSINVDNLLSQYGFPEIADGNVFEKMCDTISLLKTQLRTIHKLDTAKTNYNFISNIIINSNCFEWRGQCTGEGNICYAWDVFSVIYNILPRKESYNKTDLKLTPSDRYTKSTMKYLNSIVTKSTNMILYFELLYYYIQSLKGINNTNLRKTRIETKNNIEFIKKNINTDEVNDLTKILYKIISSERSFKKFTLKVLSSIMYNCNLMWADDIFEEEEDANDAAYLAKQELEFEKELQLNNITSQNRTIDNTSQDVVNKSKIIELEDEISRKRTTNSPQQIYRLQKELNSLYWKTRPKVDKTNKEQYLKQKYINLLDKMVRMLDLEISLLVNSQRGGSNTKYTKKYGNFKKYSKKFIKKGGYNKIKSVKNKKYFNNKKSFKKTK